MIYLTFDVSSAMIHMTQDLLEKNSTHALTISDFSHFEPRHRQRSLVQVRCDSLQAAEELLKEIEFARNIFDEDKHRLLSNC